MSRSKLSEFKASQGLYVLDPDSLEKIFAVAGNRVEVLEYFQRSLKEKIGNNAAYEELSHEVDTLVDSARHQEDEKNILSPWSGKPDLPERLLASFNKSDFTAFQEFLVKSIDQIESKSITLDYAINDETAEYLRGYSGDNLKDKDVNAMDTLFNAWLSKEDMMMRSGVVYAATKEGEPVKNSDANAVAKKLSDLLQDKERGFAAYVAQNGAKVGLTLRKNDHPAQTEEVKPSK